MVPGSIIFGTAASMRGGLRFSLLSSSRCSKNVLNTVRSVRYSFPSLVYRHHMGEQLRSNRIQHRGLASSAVTESLSSTIQKEIAHEKSQYEADKELKGFLDSNKWTLEDKVNDMLVVLTKEVDGKKVAVEFSCIQPSGAEDGEPLPEASDFTVCVTNKNGSGLLFFCSTTSEDEGARFCIGQVRHFSDQQSKDSLAEYPGPYFEDLDDAFQQQLDSWLASMGIDGDLCDFVDRFASDKENREYIRWLEKFDSFVKDK